MKLKHIRQSLDEIKESDLILLEELKETIEDLECSLNKKYTELNNIETRKDIINNAITIRDDKKRLLRFLSPILELVTMGFGMTFAISAIEGPTFLLVFIIAIILSLSTDAIYVFQREYSKVSNKDNHPLKRFFEALTNIMMKYEMLSLKKSDCETEEDSLNIEIKRLEEELSKRRSNKERINDEVSFIEGNIHAVNCLIEKYKFEDMKDDTTLVQFIEDKKELKKAIGTPLPN